MTAPPLHAQILARAAIAGITPSAEQVEKLVTYYSLLERWNQKINLTALPLAARADSTIDRLVVEPLIAARHLGKGSLNWFDFGSGGGSPALPLKILNPTVQLAMVEAKERKAAFLREAVSNLGLLQARVITARIEELAATETPESVDVITVRAVRLADEILAISRKLLKLHGSLLLFRGDGGAVDAEGFTFQGAQPLAPSTGFLCTFRKAG